RLADLPRAENRDPHHARLQVAFLRPCALGKRRRRMHGQCSCVFMTAPTSVAYEPGVVARQQVDAREPRPFPVGGEELVRLLRLAAPAPQLGGQLHEPEVPREPALVAPETLPAHDADPPPSEAALALHAPRG